MLFDVTVKDLASIFDNFLMYSLFLLPFNLFDTNKVVYWYLFQYYIIYNIYIYIIYKVY